MTLAHWLSVVWVVLLDHGKGGMVDFFDYRNRMANVVYGVEYQEKGTTRGPVDTSKPPPLSKPPSNMDSKLAALFADVPAPTE